MCIGGVVAVRVLSVAWECPFEPYGGLGVFLSRLLPEMAAEHSVVHYCMHGFFRAVHPVDFHGVRVVRVHEPLIDSGGGLLNLSSIALAGKLLYVVSLFDSLLAHDVHAALTVLIAREFGVRSGYYVHMFTYHPLDIAGVIAADSVIANSRLTAKQIQGVIRGSDVEVVYPASPYPPVNEPSSFEDGTPVVLIPSRFQDNKSPQHVLKALEDARRRVEFRVVVFGRGSELYKLPEWVEVRGTVGEGEKLELYRRAYVTLQVGFPEPFGLVALESISQGTPVLTSNQSGVSEVLPGESTYTIENLAEKLVQILSNPHEREELWYKQRESWIMRRTWKDVWREIENTLIR